MVADTIALIKNLLYSLAQEYLILLVTSRAAMFTKFGKCLHEFQ